jgi:peptidoglycan hydrolase-like protein with peptidoglycan-binding domain
MGKAGTVVHPRVKKLHRLKAEEASSTSMSTPEMPHVQQRLNELGFDAGHVDGFWGPNTQAAIRNFQDSRGLNVTGRIDEKTAECKICKYVC